MSGHSILSEVRIDGLFGYLNYDIQFSRENLCLLYGENGSGKTTLLRLIYAALSPNPSEGLRNYISMVAFRRLRIETSIGAYVEINREKAISGPYHYEVVTSDGRSDWQGKDQIGVEVIPEKEKAALGTVLDRLKQLDLDIHFLSDDRLLRSTSPGLASSIEKAQPRTRRDADGLIPLLTRTARGESDRTWLNIEMTAKQVMDAFRRQVFEQGNIGQINTNGIYVDLTKRLVTAWGEGDEPSLGFDELLAELDRLQEQSAQLVRLRSLSSPPFDELRTLLKIAPDQRKNDLVRILSPFIESTRARIDALLPIATVISLLIFELNSFLNRKRVSFEIYEGFEINSEVGKPIPLAALSSGEKQLFLLLCSAFLSRESRCIFLIDEPELSLNVYWQRNLPRTLQRLVLGAQTQYVLATHSLEILTEFSEYISTLEAAHAPS